MRLSVLNYDPGYYKRAFLYQAYFNDVKIDNCVTADEDLGEAVVYEVDRNGSFIVDHARNELIKKTLSGRIELRLKKC